jgi:hypothetical protein
MTGAESPVLLEALARVPIGFFRRGHCIQLFGVTGIGESLRGGFPASYTPDTIREAELDRIREVRVDRMMVRNGVGDDEGP